MSKKRPRIIGTTEEAIAKAETELNFKFPSAFCYWLIQNNGLGFESISIFPVFDERDPRKTFDSIVRNYNDNWLAWLENFEDEEINFEHLLPFAEFGTGDYYCFDYSKPDVHQLRLRSVRSPRYRVIESSDQEGFGCKVLSDNLAAISGKNIQHQTNPT
jgi:hypothetical protein